MPREALSLVLLSGGIDSATALHLVSRRMRVLPLYIDYGQRASERERGAANAVCSDLGLKLETLELSEVGAAFRRGHVWQAHVPLPHRNLALLGLAFSYAADRRASQIIVAVNREDAVSQKSAAPVFIDAFRALMATLDEIRLVTPLIEWDKAEVIRQGHTLGVDYAHTYSCLLGRERPCGACPQCEHRQAAFAKAGLADPVLAIADGKNP